MRSGEPFDELPFECVVRGGIDGAAGNRARKESRDEFNLMLRNRLKKWIAREKFGAAKLDVKLVAANRKGRERAAFDGYSANGNAHEIPSFVGVVFYHKRAKVRESSLAVQTLN